MRTIGTLFFTFLVASSAFCGVIFEDVTFGFDNGYRSEKWTPLHVTVRSRNEPTIFNGKLTVEVRNIYSDKPIYRYGTPLKLSKTDHKQKRLYIYCPKTTFQLYIQLERSKTSDNDSDTSVAAPQVTHEITPPTSIADKDFLALVLAPNGDKLKKIIHNKSLDDENLDGGMQAHIKYLPNTRAMPLRWIGYDPIDVVIIREVSLTEKRVLKSQQSALLDWVQRGGTLIISGGSNFQYLKGSFIEPLLPTKLIREETINRLPPVLQQKLGLNNDNGTSNLNPPDDANLVFKNIHFEPKKFCQTLLGSEEQIYIAKRDFGSGQIICFSFDYNASPFSDLKAGETFWQWLLNTHGKSPKLFAERYAPFRQHEQKIHKQFLAKMPTQLPIIKLLSIGLPLYLLGVGGFLLYTGKRRQSTQKRNRGYWVGGLIFVLVSVGVIGGARVVLPQKVSIEKFSILSIYPERENAHLQSYVSLRAAACTQTVIPLTSDTFIRPLRIQSVAKPPELFSGSISELKEILVEPWHPSTFVMQSFFSMNVQKPEMQLQNAWRITDDQANYLGTITLGSNDLWTSELPSKTLTKMPPQEELNEIRQAYAKILQQEGLLQYLLKDVKTQNRTVLIGWTSQLEQLLDVIPQVAAYESANAKEETLVIMYLDKKDIGR